jgi:acyl-CoA synthetase (AMP-forming)/AMP-acid ligase II
MMDRPLTVTQLLEHGRRVHPDREVVTWRGDHARRVSFADTYDRIQQLAAGLSSLGVGPGSVVGTFCWNHQEHVEAYFAVPCMGAVLHQLNIRLFSDQLAFVIQDLADEVIIVDGSLLPLAGARRRPAALRPHVRDRRRGRSRGARAARTCRALRRAARGCRPVVRLARARRAHGRGVLLHERDDRQPEGGRLQPPFHLDPHVRGDRGRDAGPDR